MANEENSPNDMTPSSEVSPSSGVKPSTAMTSLDIALEEANKGNAWAICIFLLCSTVGIFNAWHILVSNFYNTVPPHWCEVPELQTAGWTAEQIKIVSAPNQTAEENCEIFNWNYTMFVKMGFESSVDYIKNMSKPDMVPCSSFVYNETVPRSTVIVEWNLVCDKKLEHSNVQGSIAFGKLIGGFLAGFIADKVGRKPTHMACAALYMFSGVLIAVTESYWIFLLGRFLTGVAGAACYESAVTLLAELVSKSRRAAMCTTVNVSYPIGYIILPGLSLLFPQWRHLALAISLPMIVFLFHLWLLPESPRWLLTQGKDEQAWKLLKKINKNYDPEQIPVESKKEAGAGPPGTVAGTGNSEETNAPQDSGASTGSQFQKFCAGCKNTFLIFSTCDLIKRISISIFSYFVASFVYYVTALNAKNFGMNQHFYTFLSGCCEIPGYFSPLVIMICMGRKPAASLLYFTSGTVLVLLAFIDRDYKVLVLTLAMIGRFTNVAVFGLLVVYCAELFPTVVRNTAIGISFANSQFGSIISPYTIDLLSPVAWHLPSTLCGLCAVMSSVIILMLPETRGKPLCDTVSDIKEQPDRVSLRNCCRMT